LAQNLSHVVFSFFDPSYYSSINLLQNTFTESKYLFSNRGYAYLIRTIMTSEKIE